MASKKFLRGKQLCYDGDLTSGLELISQALRSRPRDLQFLSFKALFLSQLKEFKDSIQVAEKVLRIKSKDIKANNVVFDSSLKIGDTDKCQAHLSKMKHYRCSGQARAMMKIPEKTRQLQKYCALRGSLNPLLETKNADEVIREAEKCLRIGAYDTTVLYCKLEALLLQERHDDICKTYNEVLPLANEMTSFSKLTEVLGRSFIMQGRYQDAAELNFSLADTLTEILRLKSQASDCLNDGQSDLALIHTTDALMILEDLPLNTLTLEKELLRLQAEVSVHCGRVDVTICNIDRFAKEVDSYIDNKDFSRAATNIEEILQIIRKTAGNLPENVSSSIWERRLEDVKEAARIKALPGNSSMTRTRALLALKANENDTKREIKRKSRTAFSLYHPDRHSGKSQGWLDMYKMIAQEVSVATDYALETQPTSFQLQENFPAGFRFTEKQKMYNNRRKEQAGN